MGDPKFRIVALEVMSELKDRRAVPFLMEELKSPTDSTLTSIAVRGVAAFRASEALPLALPLLKAGLQSPSASTRREASSALTQLGWEPTTSEERCLYLIAQEEYERAAVEAGASAHLKRILNEWFFHNYRYSPTGKEASIIRAVGMCDPGAAAIHVANFVISNPHFIFSETVKIVFREQSPELSKLILETCSLIRNHVKGDRYTDFDRNAPAVIALLCRVPAPDAINAGKQLLQHPSFYVQQTAADVISAVGGETAAHVLMDFCDQHQDSPYSHYFALEGLGRLRYQPALRHILNCLGDRNVKGVALEAASNFSLDDIVAALVPLLHDPSISDKVASVLEEKGWVPANGTEQAALSVAKQDYETARKLGEVAVPALLERLRSDTGVEIRLTALATLLHMGAIVDDNALGCLATAIAERLSAMYHETSTEYVGETFGTSATGTIPMGPQYEERPEPNIEGMQKLWRTVPESMRGMVAALIPDEIRAIT
jgi:HEAT repeat protein